MSVEDAASWAVIGVAVFVAWIGLGLVLAMLWAWHRRHYRRWRDEYPYERRWREDDGDEP